MCGCTSYVKFAVFDCLLIFLMPFEETLLNVFALNKNKNKKTATMTGNHIHNNTLKTERLGRTTNKNGS